MGFRRIFHPFQQHKCHITDIKEKETCKKNINNRIQSWIRNLEKLVVDDKCHDHRDVEVELPFHDLMEGFRFYV